MLIKDFPENINGINLRALAEATDTCGHKGLIFAFEWRKTPEGHNFWEMVYCKSYDLALDKLPKGYKFDEQFLIFKKGEKIIATESGKGYAKGYSKGDIFTFSGHKYGQFLTVEEIDGGLYMKNFAPYTYETIVVLNEDISRNDGLLSPTDKADQEVEQWRKQRFAPIVSTDNIANNGWQGWFDPSRDF